MTAAEAVLKWFRQDKAKLASFTFERLPRLEWTDSERRLFECLTPEEQHEVAKRYFDAFGSVIIQRRPNA